PAQSFALRIGAVTRVSRTLTQTALLPTSDRAAVGGAAACSIDLAGSGLSAVLSSSDMPFLNALMPWATSPIRSEILPRPNSSSTTAITTIQCQMLIEPIAKTLRTDRRYAVPHTLGLNLGVSWVKNKNNAAAGCATADHA